jgi:Secretion system C-terminal sorting domain/NHL repeat
MKKLLLLLVILPVCAWGQVITTIAGNGSIGFIGNNTPAVTATMNHPLGLSVDTLGNILFADFNNKCIRKITATTGIITTIAGTGSAGYNGDSILATSALLNNPTSIAIGNLGDIYVSDAANNRIRKINFSGIITTVAGTGVAGYNGDNILATTSLLLSPSGVWVDKYNNLYISDQDNHRIRKVTASTGIITTIAGTGVAGYNGDEILATTAQLNQPYSITVDDTGNIYIADQLNYRIRKVDTFGMIHTIAGTGTFGYNGEGISATSAKICASFISLDHFGNVYISEGCDNNRVRIINSNGIISTIAGTGIVAFNGDGIPAITAQLNGPSGIFFDGCDNLYISDCFNQRIRKVWFNTDTLPQANATITPNDTVITGTQVTTTVTATNHGTVTSYQWVKNGANAGTNSAYTYTPVNGDSVYCIVTVRACTGRMYTDTTTAIHITVTGDAGVANTTNSTIHTYPNPVTDVLHVATTEPQHYMLHNLVGVALLQGSVDKQNAIDMKVVPTGIYLLQLTNQEGQREVVRVVKE